VPISDVELLKQSAIVGQILSISFDGIADSYILKVRVELKNGWLMDYWGLAPQGSGDTPSTFFRATR
jgi:hypothetical protein